MACFSYYNNNQLIKVGKTIFLHLKTMGVSNIF